MSDLKSRLTPLFRRSSFISSTRSSASSSSAFDERRNRSKTSLLLKNRESSLGSTPVYEEDESSPRLPVTTLTAESPVGGGEAEQAPKIDLETPTSTPFRNSVNPVLSLQAPTPDLLTATSGPDAAERTATDAQVASTKADEIRSSSQNNHSVTADRGVEPSPPPLQSARNGYFGEPTATPKMSYRKIWVKRAGASATLVQIMEEDLVDDVRDRILKKYGNSLGRSFDAPDVTLRIVPRDHSQPIRHPPPERTLGPEEPIIGVLDMYYPGGQKVENALIIDVPRRTPKHSPRPMPYYMEDSRPVESGSDYFPVIPAGQPSPHLPTNISMNSALNQSTHHLPPHSISVINTGHVPPLPSPGARAARLGHRPRLGRTHTTSPTVLSGGLGTQVHDSQKLNLNGAPAPPPLPTPPAPTDVPHRTASPPPQTSSSRPKPNHKSSRKAKDDAAKLPTGLLDGAVPPINVLIVEDNIINLKLLEAFMKRLKVRWHTAMNGREAVSKWRGGGFHLVLMDIQLPVMNGLDATKEIRRLERLNNIGVFSSSATNTPAAFGNGVAGVEAKDEGKVEKVEEEDTLVNTALFKSPVIIVALTASSLQSDRHEALAAGCNDFLTKPVSYIWLERKIMEWGCMQALIDFDGWRKWKNFSSASTSSSRAIDEPARKTASTSTPNAATTKDPSSSSSKKESKLVSALMANRNQRLSNTPTMSTGGGSASASASGTGSGSGEETGMESGGDGGIMAGA